MPPQGYRLDAAVQLVLLCSLVAGIVDSAKNCALNSTVTSADVKTCKDAVKISATVLDLSHLTDKEAKLFVGAKELDVGKLLVQGTTWKQFDIGPKKLTRKPKDVILEFKDNYKLEKIELDTKMFKGAMILMENCPKVPKKTMDSMKKWAAQGSTFPEQQGDCKGKVKFECQRYVELLDIDNKAEGLFDGKPLKPIFMANDTCLKINYTALKSMAFVQWPKSYDKTRFKECKPFIQRNRQLCLSNVTFEEISTVYDLAVEDVKDNDACRHSCTFQELLDGEDDSNYTCHIIESPVILDGDHYPSFLRTKFKEIYEIREGHLTIANTTKDYWNWFQNLINIETEVRAGQQPVILLRNTTLKRVDKMPLIGIKSKHGAKRIVFENNPNLNLTQKHIDWLMAVSEGDFDWDVRRTTTAGGITAAHRNADDADDEESTLLYVGVAGGVTGLLVLLLVVAGVAVFIVMWRRRSRFVLPRLPAVPDAKKKALLRSLAEEILAMNPMEWRILAQTEATAIHLLADNSKLQAGARKTYAKYLKETERRVAMSVKPPPDTDNWELFKTFRRYYDETKGDCQLILLTRDQDPVKSCPVLAGEVGEKKTITGRGLGKNQQETGKSLLSTTQSQLDSAAGKQTKFELTTVLVSSKLYDEHVTLYTYKVAMATTDGVQKWQVKFPLKLVHHHGGWHEGTKDLTTVLRLIEYGRQTAGKRRPMFLTCSPSESYAVMMLTAVLYHVTEPTYPAMTIKELRPLVSEQVDCRYVSQEWLVYLLMVTLAWAGREKLVADKLRQSHDDFAHIYDKMAHYMAMNPNNFFYTSQDLRLDRDVEERVVNSTVLLAMLQREKDKPTEDTVTLEFKKESESEPPSGDAFSKQQLQSTGPASTGPGSTPAPAGQTGATQLSGPA